MADDQYRTTSMAFPCDEFHFPEDSNANQQQAIYADGISGSGKNQFGSMFKFNTASEIENRKTP